METLGFPPILYRSMRVLPFYSLLPRGGTLPVVFHHLLLQRLPLHRPVAIVDLRLLRR